MPVSLAQAGELALWGGDNYGQSTVPASLAGVAISQVVGLNRATLALTAGGQVVGWGSHLTARLERVPAEVAAAKVAQIAGAQYYAGAVTRDGRVMIWGKKTTFTNPLAVPAELSGVKQLALSDFAAAALKDDGSVVAWGQDVVVGDDAPPSWGLTRVPVGLKATALLGLMQAFYALTDQGTVVRWGYPPMHGDDEIPMPAAVQVPGNVKAIAGSPYCVVALLADNTLETIGNGADGRCTFPVPAGVAAVEPVLLANSTGLSEFAIVDRDRVIHDWNPAIGEQPLAPVELNGRDIVQIAISNSTAAESGDPQVPTGGVIITKMLRAELPQVTGVAQVGGVLTGVPGTFSASPDAVSSQWLVDGVAAGSGAQLAVTAAMVGRTIVYSSTATKAGEGTVTSSSGGVVVPAVAAPPVGPVSSSTTVVTMAAAKKGASVTVTGTVSASKSPAGQATVTIVKGKKAIVTKTVPVSASGAVTLTVKKFAQLVAKKTKAKGKKAKTAYRGAYTVTIAYAGTPLVKASTGTKKVTIK